MDTLVHVLHSNPLGSDHGDRFAVMFAPVSRAGQDAVMRPHYLSGRKQLVDFLTQVGFSDEAAGRIEVDLRTQSSVSVRAKLPHSRDYRLFFKPVMIQDGGKERLAKVEVRAVPILGDHQWQADFRVIDDLIIGLENAFSLPKPQLLAFRKNLLSGQPATLGGLGGCELHFNQEQLLQLGMLRANNGYQQI